MMRRTRQMYTAAPSAKRRAEHKNAQSRRATVPMRSGTGVHGAHSLARLLWRSTHHIAGLRLCRKRCRVDQQDTVGRRQRTAPQWAVASLGSPLWYVHSPALRAHQMRTLSLKRSQASPTWIVPSRAVPVMGRRATDGTSLGAHIRRMA